MTSRWPHLSPAPDGAERLDPRSTPRAEAILNPINHDMGLHPIQPLELVGIEAEDTPPPLCFLCGVQVQDLFAGHHPVLFLAASSLDLASLLQAIFICLLLYKKPEKLSCLPGSHSLEGEGGVCYHWSGPMGNVCMCPWLLGCRST